MVLRCPACNNCHGARGKTVHCPHCGNRLGDNALVVSTCDSASELRIEVALANTPEELRDELRTRLVSQEKLFSKSQQVTPGDYKKWLFNACDSEGTLTLESLEKVMRGKNSQVSASQLIEQAHADGILVQSGEGNWILLN